VVQRVAAKLFFGASRLRVEPEVVDRECGATASTGDSYCLRQGAGGLFAAGERGLLVEDESYRLTVNRILVVVTVHQLPTQGGRLLRHRHVACEVALMQMPSVRMLQKACQPRSRRRPAGEPNMGSRWTGSCQEEWSGAN
jgi:hypothetical protein